MQKIHLWNEWVHLPSVEDIRFATGQSILHQTLAGNQDTGVLVVLDEVKQRQLPSYTSDLIMVSVMCYISSLSCDATCAPPNTVTIPLYLQVQKGTTLHLPLKYFFLTLKFLRIFLIWLGEKKKCIKYRAGMWWWYGTRLPFLALVCGGKRLTGVPGQMGEWSKSQVWKLEDEGAGRVSALTFLLTVTLFLRLG